MKKRRITNYKIGDVVFFSPYILHKTIENNHDKESRWTLIVHFDDMKNSIHLKKDTAPFNREKFATTLTNAEHRKIFSAK